MLDTSAAFSCSKSLENDTEIATVGGAAVNSKAAAGGVEDDIISAAVIGPYKESSVLVLRCKAGGGRPVPEVSYLVCEVHVLYLNIKTMYTNIFQSL